jgi:hypothetical protein
MAPARMMQFVDQHIKGCPVCKSDLLLPDEVEKIREFVLPESRISKATRTLEDDDSTPEISPDEEDEFEERDEYVDEDSEDDLDAVIDEDDDLNEEDII